ncbi:MAG: deoxyribonuclease IV [Candidatus Doudnabacteria bacterium]|nr:deoxyribonuclease IV [Candidatus Doudnabacteria bacterium]
MNKLTIGCHVSAAGGVWNAPKNACDLACETFQIFTRPPMGGKAPKLDGETIKKFQSEMGVYGYSYRYGDSSLVVHCPYFINFGSSNPRVYHGSVSVVRQELDRASLLGAKYVMTHLGSFKDLGPEKGMKQTKAGLKEVLKGYKGSYEFLLEIAAGAGEIIGDTFEELAELMEPLVKMKGFGGICFDTQHAFSSGYDIRTAKTVASTFKKFDKAIGLKWLKMSHINDSKIELGGRKDRHEHIGEGQINRKGFEAILRYFNKNFKDLPLILETEHDKVKIDIKILKKLRNQIL